METMTAEIAESRGAVGIFPPSTTEEMTNLISERMQYFHRIARRRLDNMADAEDAVQDALLSAWKNLDKFKGQAQMSTWLTVIVMNSARMLIRKRPRALHLALDTDQDDEGPRLEELLRDPCPDPEAQVRRRELEQRLHELSRQLPPKLREIVEVRSLDGLNTRETANALGLSESAVKTRLARARQQLKMLAQSGSGQVAKVPRRRRKAASSPRG